MKALFVLFLSFTAFQNYIHAADNTDKIMRELSTGLDIAESSLRIILNEPVKGSKFSYKQVNCENQLKAAMALLNFEMRHPGYLQGNEQED